MSTMPFFKRDTPKMPSQDDFDEAFRKLSEDDSLKPKAWSVTDPSSPRHIPRREPAPALTALAERMFEHMFAKQDSVICEPDELAERAWELAEAFARAHTKRIK